MVGGRVAFIRGSANGLKGGRCNVWSVETKRGQEEGEGEEEEEEEDKEEEEGEEEEEEEEEDE